MRRTLAVALALAVVVGSLAGATRVGTGAAPPEIDDRETFTIHTESIQMQQGGQICAESLQDDVNKVTIRNANLRGTTMYYNGQSVDKVISLPSSDLDGELVLYTNGENSLVNTLAQLGMCIPVDQPLPVTLEVYYLSAESLNVDNMEIAVGHGIADNPPEPGGLALSEFLGNVSLSQADNGGPGNETGGNASSGNASDGGSGPTDTVNETTDTVNETADTVNETTDTVDDTTDSVNETADGATDTVNDTVDNTTDAANETTDDPTDTVDNTTDTVNETVGDTTDTVNETAGGTTDSVNDTVNETTDPIGDAVDETADTVGDAVNETVNTVDDTLDAANETLLGGSSDDGSNSTDDSSSSDGSDDSDGGLLSLSVAGVRLGL